MKLFDHLEELHRGSTAPFLISPTGAISFAGIARAEAMQWRAISPGDVVALIGDFDARSIATLLRLFDAGAIVVPVTADTASMHDYFFETAHVDTVIDRDSVRRLRKTQAPHPLLEQLRTQRHPGLVLFSSGTTGRPKAILHDLTKFLIRYRTPRPSLTTLCFLLFDHIGGLNTLLHTMFNKGCVVVPSDRKTATVIREIMRHKVDLLPTTPTFLRMLLVDDTLEPAYLSQLKIITYGTEKMDEPTLRHMCARLPWVDFRQTYGMSELGILRVKSKRRDSLWITIGGKGVSTKNIDNVLHIKSEFRMTGYLNAESPFIDGWFDTGDIVEQSGDYLKIIGRTKQVINVGGVKILPSEIERVALLHPDVLRCIVVGADNPITGQHIEVTCELRKGATATKKSLIAHFKGQLPESLRPHRIRIGCP